MKLSLPVVLAVLAVTTHAAPLPRPNNAFGSEVTLAKRQGKAPPPPKLPKPDSIVPKPPQTKSVPPRAGGGGKSKKGKRHIVDTVGFEARSGLASRPTPADGGRRYHNEAELVLQKRKGDAPKPKPVPRPAPKPAPVPKPLPLPQPKSKKAKRHIEDTVESEAHLGPVSRPPPPIDGSRRRHNEVEIALQKRTGDAPKPKPVPPPSPRPVSPNYDALLLPPKSKPPRASGGGKSKGKRHIVDTVESEALSSLASRPLSVGGSLKYGGKATGRGSRHRGDGEEFIIEAREPLEIDELD